MACALLLPYKISGPEGPQIYLQVHSNGRTLRLWGGKIKKGESPLDAVYREIDEELNIKLNRQRLGQGWTPIQLLCRMRIPFGSIYLFPIEVHDEWPPKEHRILEGSGGKWLSVQDLSQKQKSKQFSTKIPKLLYRDKLLIRLWALRRFVLNQPYINTPLQCPIITIDLEEPHHYTGKTGNECFSKRKSNLPEVIIDLLMHLECAGAHATFFCVAKTAEKYPNLIRQIIKAGHEVQSHGTDHQLASTQTLVRFREDITRSKKVLEDISGEKVVGYRAPGWSWPSDANQRSRFYEVLEKAGYIFDSSVIPAAIIGIPGLPSIPYQTDTGIWEFPLPGFGIPIITKNLDRFAKSGVYMPPRYTWRGSLCIPYSGGVFLRCMGKLFSNVVLSYHLKKRGYAMTYIHPRELSGEDSSWIRGLDNRYHDLFERWRIGFRTRKFKKSYLSLLANFSGCSIQEYLNNTFALNPC